MKTPILVARVVLGLAAAALALISCRPPRHRRAQAHEQYKESRPARDENGMLLDRPTKAENDPDTDDGENAGGRIINKMAKGRQFGFAVQIDGAAGATVECIVENRKTSSLVFNQEIKDLESDSVQKDFSFTSNSNPADLVISLRMKTSNRLLDQAGF